MVGIDMKRGTITLPSVKQVLLVFAVCLIVGGIYDDFDPDDDDNVLLL